ncbi:MAG: [FeFe] hydrogenase H-cluster radical SAM maturase HydE [Spirochaetia bacterium]|jgi:biotin synthase|nr:[FeFe] hydrogenase H-cluster radical SAM maturase HydE [Spirochaetia bacterium]
MEKQTNKDLIAELESKKILSDEGFRQLLSTFTTEDRLLLAQRARTVCDRVYGKKIYLRGIIEFTNWCRNDCLYCGLRRSNKEVVRYRMNKEEILSCCKVGYTIGMRTFVLQGGEDLTYDASLFEEIIRAIRKEFPDCAITLSVGEREHDLYQKWFDAGADRFLLRHESADPIHYAKMHPKVQTLQHRLACLEDLKQIGYQVGAGMMVGAPYQTVDNLVTDLRYLEKFRPHMIGIGPFIPHSQTPFRNEPQGSFDLTLVLLSILRLMRPTVLLPATTAMDTVRKYGRKEAVLAGCNVIMPNITPARQRANYKLYNDMAELRTTHSIGINEINDMLRDIAYYGVTERGDYKEEAQI